MQVKWMEDFVALAQTRSFLRAAELRNVTPPAFGRRIQALEAWAGMPLVQRGESPLQLTPAGELFLETASQTVIGLEDARAELRSATGRQERTLTIATGRTLARTVMADWLLRLRPVLKHAQVRILTRALLDTVRLLEQNEVDFTLVYHHPALTFRLDGRQFTHVTVASDKLVPVARAGPRGEPLYLPGRTPAVPLLSYGRGLAMGRLLEDHLAHNPIAPRLTRSLECDSADALAEYVLKGLGVAWLPWSLVRADCKAGRMAVAGDRSMEIAFEVRLYRPKRRLSALNEQVWQSDRKSVV